MSNGTTLSKEGNEIVAAIAKLLQDLQRTYARAEQRETLLADLIYGIENQGWLKIGGDQQKKEITLHLRSCIDGEKITLAMLGSTISQILKLVLLVEQKHDIELKIPDNIEKALKLWAERVEAAEKAQAQYVK